jgi:hypothetical protein
MGSRELTVRDVEGIAELRRVGELQQRVADCPAGSRQWCSTSKGPTLKKRMENQDRDSGLHRGSEEQLSDGAERLAIMPIVELRCIS